ncbi:MAG: hypothetical protein GW917_00950 [Bdellovibrionales bacterium]|nr:hypothetical protein [Bdellovibrionales bacterium]
MRQSISGMILAAKELEPNAFTEDEQGGSDDCLQSHMVFSRNSSISTFKKKGLQILEPLAEYAHFLEVDFSENEIEDLAAIASWDRLEKINLKDNKIRDLFGAQGLRSLTQIVLTNNRIRSLTPLQGLAQLERVDARNNFDSISCEGFSNQVTCLSATIRTDASFSPLATKTLRPLFEPSVVELSQGEFAVASQDRYIQKYSSSTNAFSLLVDTGSESHGRVLKTLPSGNLLLVGGWRTSKAYGVLDLNSNFFNLAPLGLNVSRSADHTVTTLDDGRVLVAGGWEGQATWTGGNATYTAELLMEDGSTRVLGNMHAPRAWHTATKLNDGRVLIVGGFKFDGGLATAEIFDPISDQFVQLNSALHEGRGAHTATLMNDGRVLIAGGFGLDSKAVSSAEIFDPRTNRFTKILEPMNVARAMHEALLLKSGKILFLGGSVEVMAPDHPLNFSFEGFIQKAEIFDPQEDSFIEIPSRMFLKRARPKMIEVQPGTVFVLGGLSWASATQAEVFNYIDLE